MYSRALNMGAAAFADNGRLLALGQNDEAAARKVYLADLATGKKVRELAYTTQGNSGITGIVAHPDGKHLATCGRDTMVRIWQLADGKLVKELGKTRERRSFWRFAVASRHQLFCRWPVAGGGRHGRAHPGLVHPSREGGHGPVMVEYRLIHTGLSRMDLERSNSATTRSPHHTQNLHLKGKRTELFRSC